MGLVKRPERASQADDDAFDSDTLARITHVRSRTVPEGQETSQPAEASDAHDAATVPAVSGDDCVRALLACGCNVEALEGRAWALSCGNRRILVPRHAALDAEILLELLATADVTLDRFRRTLDRLDLLRGDPEPRVRPAQLRPHSVHCGREEHGAHLSGDELAEALAVYGWLVWERGPLVTRLARRGQLLVVRRARGLDPDFVRLILRQATRQG